MYTTTLSIVLRYPSRDRGKTQLAFFRHARRSYRKRTVSDHCRDGKGIQSKSVRIPQVPAGEQAEQGDDGRPVSKPCSLERDRTGTLQEQNRVKRLPPETVSYGFGIKNGGYPETRRLLRIFFAVHFLQFAKFR